MNREPGDVLPQFRFGLRSILLVVTGFCIIAGMFWFVSIVLLLFFSALLAQLVFFLLFQRFVNWIGSDVKPDPTADDSDGG